MRRTACALALACLVSPVAAEPVAGYYPGDVLLWNRMFQGVPALVQPVGVPVAGVLPHHDIDLVTIGRYYRSLAGEPSTIVLLSPNHFEWGQAPFILPKARFQTVDGDLVPDEGLVRQFGTALGNLAETTSEPWFSEHGIFTHAPFLRHFFPAARFLPILVKMGASEHEVETLAAFLDQQLPRDALVLGSVDFSHYQIATVAGFHDLTTARALTNAEQSRLMTVEVDSPESLSIISRFAQARGAVGTQVAITSSGEFSRNPFSETTSHQYWTFTPGLPQPETVLTLAVGGRLVRDGSWNPWDYWPWDRSHSDPDPVRRDLELLAGKEARFLNGFDLYLFGNPNEGDTLIGGTPCFLRRWGETRDFASQAQALPRHGFVAVVRDGVQAFTDAELEDLAKVGVDLVVDRANLRSPTPYRIEDLLLVPSLGDLTAVGDGEGQLALLVWTPRGWKDPVMFRVDIHGSRPQAIHQFGFPAP